MDCHHVAGKLQYFEAVFPPRSKTASFKDNGLNAAGSRSNCNGRLPDFIPHIHFNPQRIKLVGGLVGNSGRCTEGEAQIFNFAVSMTLNPDF